MTRKYMYIIICLTIILIIISTIIYNYNFKKDPSKTQLNESDVKEYFLKEFSVNEEEIEIINLQRCIEKQDKKTDFYVIQLIVQKNTTMIYYYNIKSDEYIKHLEYTSEYPNIYFLFNEKNVNEEIWHGYINFYVLDDMQRYIRDCMDCISVGYKNDSLDMRFIVGFAYNFEGLENESEYKEENRSINEVDAKIISYFKDEYFAGVNFKIKDVSFISSCKSKDYQNTALDLYETIKFE